MGFYILLKVFIAILQSDLNPVHDVAGLLHLDGDSALSKVEDRHVDLLLLHDQSLHLIGQPLWTVRSSTSTTTIPMLTLVLVTAAQVSGPLELELLAVSLNPLLALSCSVLYLRTVWTTAQSIPRPAISRLTGRIGIDPLLSHQEIVLLSHLFSELTFSRGVGQFSELSDELGEVRSLSIMQL